MLRRQNNKPQPFDINQFPASNLQIQNNSSPTSEFILDQTRGNQKVTKNKPRIKLIGWYPAGETGFMERAEKDQLIDYLDDGGRRWPHKLPPRSPRALLLSVGRGSEEIASCDGWMWYVDG